MATPATYTSRMVNLLAPGGAEVEGDHVVAIPVLLGDAGRHLDRHAEAELRGIGLDVDQVAAHRHALGQIDEADQVGLALVGQAEERDDRAAAARRGGRGSAHAVRVAPPGAPCPVLVTGRGAEYAWRPWTPSRDGSPSSPAAAAGSAP